MRVNTIPGWIILCVLAAMPPIAAWAETEPSPAASPLSALDGAAADAHSRAPSIKHWVDGESIKRSYVHQPPMVPHRIAEYRVTLRHNKCMSCHSWDNYKKNRATKISQTHFEDRDGNVGSQLAARRYFCTQCHVPQVDAPPLVENEFTPVRGLR